MISSFSYRNQQNTIDHCSCFYFLILGLRFVFKSSFLFYYLRSTIVHYFFFTSSVAMEHVEQCRNSGYDIFSYVEESSFKNIQKRRGEGGGAVVYNQNSSIIVFDSLVIFFLLCTDVAYLCYVCSECAMHSVTHIIWAVNLPLKKR